MGMNIRFELMKNVFEAIAYNGQYSEYELYKQNNQGIVAKLKKDFCKAVGGDDFKSQNVDGSMAVELFKDFAFAYALGVCLDEDDEGIRGKVLECIRLIGSSSDLRRKILPENPENSDCDERSDKCIKGLRDALDGVGIDDKAVYDEVVAHVYRCCASVGSDTPENDLFEFACGCFMKFFVYFRIGKPCVRKGISNIMVEYFRHYLEQTAINKRFFYTDMELMRKHIGNVKEYSPDCFGKTLLSVDEIDWHLDFYLLFDKSEWGFWVNKLFKKVFSNVDLPASCINEMIREGNKCMKESGFFEGTDLFEDERCYKSYWLFECVLRYVRDANKWPGVIILLYMLGKEISHEEFQWLFPDKPDFDLDQIQESMWKDILCKFDVRDKNKGRCRDYDKMYTAIEGDIKTVAESYLKERASSLNLKEYVSNDKEYEFRCEMLENLVFVSAWENCQYFEINQKEQLQQDPIKYREFKVIKNGFRDVMMLGDFCTDGVTDESWFDIEKKVDTVNKVAKFIIGKELYANGKAIEYNSTNRILLETAFYLSRIQSETESSFSYLISYLDTVRKDIFNVDYKDNNLSDEDLKKNTKDLNSIDSGFDTDDYIVNVYPFFFFFFKAKPGVEKSNDYMLRKRTSIKLFCCSDSIYEDKNEDKKGGNGRRKIRNSWRNENKKAFRTNYLYKDRNMAIHHVSNSTVESLLKEENWYKLLYALCDYHEYLSSDGWKECIFDKGYERGIGLQRNVQCFVLEFIRDEIRHLIQELIERLRLYCGKKIALPDYPFYDYDMATGKVVYLTDESEKDVVKEIEQEMRAKGEHVDKQDGFCKPTGLDYREVLTPDSGHLLTLQGECRACEKSFRTRLKMFLDIMFNANGENEMGYEHNKTYCSLFKIYHSQIALYLMYVAGEFSRRYETKISKNGT